MSHETRTNPPTYPEVLDIHDGAFSESIWGSDGFRTIKVSGQSDVIADSYKDDLTIAAGTNVTLTTNAAGDTLTIAATPGTVYTAGNGITINGSEISVSAVALTTVQTAANQTAHLALTAQEGDVVVRSDENKSYVKNAGTAGNMSDYTLLATPTDLVLSVAGNTGAVTAAQIKTAYESNAQTNAFTDTEKSKLSGIETGATADQTNEEIQDIVGGMLTGNTETGITVTYEDGDGTIDFVVASQTANDFTNTLKNKLDGIETDATADQTAAEIRAAVEAASDSNVFTDADHTKLNAIDVSADVTDATTVDAAGAVMNSDLDVKGELLVGDGSGDPSALSVGTDGYILKADSSTATGLVWAAAGAGGENNQNAFSTVAVSGQDNVVADTATDTLTLAAGSNVTLTTNATSDTVTIAASNTDSTKMPLAGGTFTGDITINDNEEIRVGTGNDLVIVHDGSNSFIKEGTGTLDIRAKNTNGGLVTISDSAGENLIKATAGSSVELTYDGTKKLETTSAGVTVTGTLTATLANDSITNAMIASDAVTSDSIGDGAVTGAQIQANAVSTGHIAPNTIVDADIAANTITGASIADDAIGIGELSATGTASSSTYLRGDNTWQTISAGGLSNVVEDTSPQLGGDLDTNSFEISLDDGHAVKFGDSNDLQIEHTGSNSTITDSGAGKLILKSDNQIELVAANNESMIEAIVDGEVKLYHNGVYKAKTVSGGFTVDGTCTATAFSGDGSSLTNITATDSTKLPLAGGTLTGNVRYNDNIQAQFGSSGDMLIYHDGSTGSFIKEDSPTGHLNIGASQVVIQNADMNETCANFIPDGAVELYHNNVKKFETTSAGATVTGTLTATLAANSIDSDHYVDGSIDNAHLADDAVGIAELSATGTASSSTYLRGDNTWATVSGGITSDAQYNTVGGTSAGNSFSGTDAIQNTLFGWCAGTAITTGDYNTAVGKSALDGLTTGAQNSAFGANALGGASMTGTSNNAFGSSSMTAVTSGGFNAAFGNESLEACTTGNYNVGVGHKALEANTTGTDNVAVGASAMALNTTGGENVAIGVKALDANTTASDNVAIGKEALTANTTGSKNIGIGKDSLKTVTTSGANVAVGDETLRSNTAADNVAIGNHAMYANTSASYNTAIGTQALHDNTTGASNTAVGYRALYENTTASANTGIGEYALRNNSTGYNGTAVGYRALYNNTTGIGNNALGVLALSEVTTGAGNNAFGYYALKNTTGQYNTAMGHGAGETNAGGGSNCAFGYQALGLNAEGSNNVAIGRYALYDNTGSENTACGDMALYENTSGTANVAVGKDALKNNTTGAGNNALGHNAGDSVTTGNEGVFIGRNAGHSATTGSSNTFVGYGAGETVTTGTKNTAVGCDAFRYGTGDNNTCLGREAGDISSFSGSNNVILGYQADPSSNSVSNEITLGNSSITKFRIPGINFVIKDTTATDNYVLTVDSNGEAGWEAAAGGGASAGELYVRAYNVGSLSSTGSTLACGDKSGESLTSADENAFYGYEAGRQCTSGDRNTFIGSQAGENTTTKDDNTAVGSEAMRQNTTGEYNTAVGQGALQNNTTGDKSTAVGYRALRAQSSTSAATQNAAVGFGAAENLTAADSTAMGYGALGSATTGDANTCFGNCAGGALTTGTQNTFLGNRADQSATTASHCIVIGSWAELSANDTSGEIVLGTTNNDDLRCNTQTISALSDARDKTDIVDLPTGLDFVNSLRPVKFKWETREGNIKDGKYAAGFLAQDLQAAEEAASSTNYTDLVSTKNLDKLEAKYGNLVPILVQAVKELSAKVNTLENTLNNG